MLTEWLFFVFIMALGQFAPGPDMILLTRVSLADGRNAGWATSLGIATGLCVHAGLALGGVAVLLAKGGMLAMLLRYAACFYLVWLSVQLMRAAMKGEAIAWDERETSSHSSLFKAWRRGLLCNILNPKVAVFLGSVVAPFLRGEHSALWPVALWGTIVLEGVLLWCLWVSLLQLGGVRRIYGRLAKWIDIGFAVALLVMAGMLLIG